MKFATALGLLQIAAASPGVAGASPSASVGPRAGAAADAPEPRRLRRRALADAVEYNYALEEYDEDFEQPDQYRDAEASLGPSFVRPRSGVDAVEITVFNGCIEDSSPGYTATDVSVATCAGVGQDLATAAECERAAASLGFGGVNVGAWTSAPPGCFCQRTTENCRFNMRSVGPARENIFLVCKDTPACHRQVVTLEGAISGKEDGYGRARLSVDTSDWCVDAPFLEITLSGVHEYAFHLGPPHGSKQDTPGRYPHQRPVRMGSSTVCPLYRGIAAFQVAAADYADCMEKHGRNVLHNECTAKLEEESRARNALEGFADDSLVQVWEARAELERACRRPEEQGQLPEIGPLECNAQRELLEDARAWMNKEKELYGIGDGDEGDADNMRS